MRSGLGAGVAGLLLPVALAGVGGARPAAGAQMPSIVVAQIPVGVPTAGAAAAPRPADGEGGRLLLVSPSGATRVLSAGFDSAADPEVSFDGQSLLFAGRKTKADPWCVWEMKADGDGVHRISCGDAGARQPIYQSTIYTITPTNVEPWVQIAFTGMAAGEWNEAGVAPNSSLWSCKSDGSALRRLTFNLSNDLDPVILPDGRMVYAGWLNHSAALGKEGRVALLGVNEDGTDYQQYAGDAGLAVKRMPAAVGGEVVFVESAALGGDGAGRLAAVSQVRPLHSYRSLTGEADGLFRSPASLPDGSMLVGWRQDESGTYGIYRFDPRTKTRERVVLDPAWHSLVARPLAPRAVPDARSSVVRQDDPEGRLFSLDVNLNDLGESWVPGTAKRLRVIEGVAAREGAPPQKRLLGELPIASDGSYQVQVPADTPLQLQLLDADGLALRTSAWLWVRNHDAQGCVGCHEDRELAPPNRFVKALQSPAPVLDAPPEKRRRVGYATDVGPIVEARCRSCHGASGQGPRLELSAEGLARGEARRGRLLRHLLGRDTDRPWDAGAGSARPAALPEALRPTPAEIRTFVEWIDLGGQP